jgi:RpiB/LacA/LacB family sugar-phosphate isomerase
MRVAIACDHGGFLLKESVINAAKEADWETIDLGTFSSEPVDYPDFAKKTGETIQAGQAERGIIICGSGIGACIAANKMKGIYASICHDSYSAHQGVEHDQMNILCLGARIIGVEPAKEIVKSFLNAKPFHDERYLRRFEKVKEIERKG